MRAFLGILWYLVHSEKRSGIDILRWMRYSSIYPHQLTNFPDFPFENVNANICQVAMWPTGQSNFNLFHNMAQQHKGSLFLFLTSTVHPSLKAWWLLDYYFLSDEAANVLQRENIRSFLRIYTAALMVFDVTGHLLTRPHNYVLIFSNFILIWVLSKIQVWLTLVVANTK